MKISKKLFVLPFLVFAMSSCGKTPEPEEETFTVVWKNYDGKVLETDKDVKKGTMPHYDSAEPTKASTNTEVFNFSGWSPKVVKVTKDATYTAQFGSGTRLYTIEWVDGNGEVCKTDHLEFGATPQYVGEDPTKEKTEDLIYSFTGWEEEIVEVTGDAQYHATFDSAPRPYFSVSIINPDISVAWSSTKVDPGTTLNPLDFDLTYEDGSSIEYSYIGFADEAKPITSNINYVAVYMKFSFSTDHYTFEGLTCNEFAGDIVVPETFKGYPVTQIYFMAFSGVTAKSFTIGSNVTYIGESAFSYSNIERVVIPNQVTVVDSYAFYHCEQLKEVEFKSTSLMIRQHAFRYTAIQELELTSAINYVGSYAFADCHSLYVVSIADPSVLEATAFAFDGSITEVWLPNGGTIPGSHDISYYYYTEISGAALDTDKGTFTTQDPDDENNELGLVFYTPHGSSANKYLVSCFGNGYKLGTGDANRIKKYAFYKNQQITEVNIGKDVIVVEEKGFYAAEKVTKFELEEGTDGLDFWGYNTLGSLGISSIDFSPRPVDHLGFYLLNGCSKLSSIVFSSATTQLYDYCLDFCGFVELNIPAQITSIGTDAFRNRSKLERFVVADDNPNYKSVNDCLYSKDGKTLYAYPSAKVCEDNTFTIPEGVTTLRGRVFSNGCTLETVNLPSTLQEIGEFAFLNCSNITTVNYPRTVAEFEALSLYTSYSTHWAHNVTFTEVTCSNGSSSKNMPA